ncbi:hypothetical protein HY638_03525 [Candidatus Woesearchaeota archaeon]|nr:hypothetical protein [Candidatus Woesearchaeota archaeon]
MRDFLLFTHIIIGLAIIASSIVILLYLKMKAAWIKPLAIATAAVSWILLLPSGMLYIQFYPATKTLIKAGSWPWAHSVVMETKEHWGLLIPIIATVAALLVYTGKKDESRRWWILLALLSGLMAVMGRIVKIGALA